MDHQQIFPTSVFLVDDFIPLLTPTEKEDVKGMKTYSCKKCGLTIPVTCSQCDRVVDIKIVGEGCLVKENKCLDCSSVPIIKDVCLEQTA